MPKRRRERDKPKAGPDALYNPNKRVLLSYASDEDEEANSGASEQPFAGVRAVMDDAQLKDYQLDEYPNDESDAQVDAQTIHDTERSSDEYTPAPANETPAGKYVEDSKIGVRRNQATNQFPTLGLVSYQWEEGEDENEEYDSTTEEAMAYLKSVRCERQNIPEILSASRPTRADQTPLNTIYDGAGDHDPDEAFIASPSPAEKSDDDPTNPQFTFTKALKDRFATQHDQLHMPTSVGALAALGDKCPISFPRGNTKAYAEWHRIVSSMAPQPAQLRSLEQETVYDLLELIQKYHLVKGKNIKKATSSWIWSLLARLDTVGNMTNDQIYPLRQLGKRAVYLQYTITNPELADQLEALGQAGDVLSGSEEGIVDAEGDGNAGDEENRRTTTFKQPLKPNGLHDNLVTENTKATIDMMLIVVGDIFGQRDLLEFREPWTQTTAEGVE